MVCIDFTIMNNKNYLNEIRIIKQLTLNLYKKYFKIEVDSKENKAKNWSLFCNNYIKDNNCVWNNNDVCSFAHTFEDLDETRRIKIIELGIQSFYYIYTLKKEKNKKLTFFDYIESRDKVEKLYIEEVKSLSIIKDQYNKLHNFIIKMKNEYEFQKELFPYQLKNHCNYIVNNNFFNCKEIDTIKLKLNEFVGCKICYRNIIDFNDNSDDTFNINKGYKFITLSCGHSICDQCHISMINSKTTIYINCPICRNDNKLENTNPNYELNEQIFKIKTLIKMFKDMFYKFECHITNINKNVFINKSNSKLYDKSFINNIKAHEAPW